MTYDEYISSPLWRKKREDRLALDEVCQGCGETSSLEVHHKYAGPPGFSYKKPLGEESVLEDLIALCKWCHEAITSSVRERRYSHKSFPEFLSVVSKDTFGDQVKNIKQAPELTTVPKLNKYITSKTVEKPPLL